MKRNGHINTVKNLLILSRPKQWIKSLLIIVPPLISGEVLAWNFNEAISFFKILLAFVVASINIYLLNDWIDIERDKLHPNKKNRPLAAGTIKKTNLTAYSIFILLLLLFLLVNSQQNIKLIIVSYLGLNLLYTLSLKKIAYWEMFAVSLGFVLRALAGTTLVTKQPSSEFFAIIFFGSLLVVVAKRMSELEHDAKTHRKVLANYKTSSLKNIINLCTAIIIGAYFIFISSTFFSRLSPLPTFILYFSILPFMVIMFLIQELAIDGKLEAPETQFISNRKLLINSIIWILLFVFYALMKDSHG